MRGVRWLRPVRPIGVPSWDLSVVSWGSNGSPVWALRVSSRTDSDSQITLLLALTSLKRVGDLQALSIIEMFSRVWSKWPCGLGLAMSPMFYLNRFALKWSCFTLFILFPLLQVRMRGFTCSVPVWALKIYVDRSKLWRKSPKLLVCFGAGLRGLATSKHRISHWVRDAISLAYEVRGLPSPLSIPAHSTRGVASSQALFKWVLLGEYLCSGSMVLSTHFYQVL